MDKPYVGRFAPSPTGPLHAGSVVAALASWLDARAHGGRWLVRIEDVDGPRCVPGADQTILAQLAALGLHADAPVVRQSDRGPPYEAALLQLSAAGLAYACTCTRSDVVRALGEAGLQRPRHGELVYPGTCRPDRRGPLPGRPSAWRLRVPDAPHDRIDWTDRRLGAHWQDLARSVGDFVLRRSDGLWAYQLAVVVDDAGQGVTDVVRGEDLADNTPRQILLQRCLGLHTPRYLHTPLVLDAHGEKLSKQTGAVAADTDDALATLRAAGAVLGIVLEAGTAADWRAAAIERWKRLWVDPPHGRARPA